MHTFTAPIAIIGVNPYVYLPPLILEALMNEAVKAKGPVPVRLLINKKPFTQTLVKYAGEWRLYLNGPMLKGADKRVGDEIKIAIGYDAEERTVPLHPKLAQALKENIAAKEKFDSLPPSRRKEIVRYIARLKSEEAVDKNVRRAINFLLEKERFIGRDKP